MINIDLFNLLNQRPYSFYFLVVDNFLDIELYPQLNKFHLIYAFKNDKLENLKTNKTPYFCLEEQGELLAEKNSGKLLSHPKVVEYIKSTAGDTTPAIIPFKPSSKIDIFCQKNNWINVSNPGPLNRFLEDKIKFPEICSKFHLPIIENQIDLFNSDNFNKYQNLFGTRLVLQTHFGWAGKSTYTATSWADVEHLIPINTPVKYSPFLTGYSLLNNCCLTQYGLIQSPPALQYTGIKPFTINPFTTVGRQWPCLASIKIQQQVKTITEQFSQILQKLNYKGFFGLDFFVSNGMVYLLECNPRLTASFAFYTKIEISQNITPLFFMHLAEFLSFDYSLNLKEEQERFYNENIIGSELTQKDFDNNTIKKVNDFSVFSDSLDPITIKPKIVNMFTF